MKRFFIGMMALGMVFVFLGVVNADSDDTLSGYYASSPLPFQDAGVNGKPSLSASSERESGTPLAPTLGLAIKGTTVMLSWTSISDAIGYKLFYAPYLDVSYIKSIDMGGATSISVDLWDGAVFYLAVQAYNSSGYSSYSNIVHFVISSSDSVYDYAQDTIKGYMDGDADFLMTRFSKDALDDGVDFNCMYSTEKYWLSNNTVSKITYYINNVMEYTEGNKRFATINRTRSTTWYYQSDQGPYTSTVTKDITLIFEDGKWKYYGNQKGYQTPSVNNIVACKHVDAETGVPVGIKTVFTQADSRVGIFCDFSNMGNGFTWQFKWYQPDGTLAYERSPVVIDWGEDYPECNRGGAWRCWYLDIVNYYDFWGARQGQWRVDIYINDTFAGQTFFEYKVESEDKSLEITFDPNPAPATRYEKSDWWWDLTYIVYNPNYYNVEVLAFGQFNECLTNMNQCTYTQKQFADWFNDGSIYISARKTVPNNGWWLRGYANHKNVTGKYAMWYKDNAGNIKVAISEPLTLLKP